MVQNVFQIRSYFSTIPELDKDLRTPSMRRALFDAPDHFKRSKIILMSPQKKGLDRSRAQSKLDKIWKDYPGTKLCLSKTAIIVRNKRLKTAVSKILNRHKSEKKATRVLELRKDDSSNEGRENLTYCVASRSNQNVARFQQRHTLMPSASLCLRRRAQSKGYLALPTGSSPLHEKACHPYYLKGCFIENSP